MSYSQGSVMIDFDVDYLFDVGTRRRLQVLSHPLHLCAANFSLAMGSVLGYPVEVDRLQVSTTFSYGIFAAAGPSERTIARAMRNATAFLEMIQETTPSCGAFVSLSSSRPTQTADVTSLRVTQPLTDSDRALCGKQSLVPCARSWADVVCLMPHEQCPDTVRPAVMSVRIQTDAHR